MKLIALAALSLALSAGSAFAIDLTDETGAPLADTAVLNAGDNNPQLDLSGGVGAGPDLSGMGSVVQVIQPQTGINSTSSSQSAPRYYSAAPPVSGTRP